jgi:acyl carrier protein
MVEILINYINEQFVDEDFQDTIELEDDLLSEGVLDSFGMMKLIRFIESKFEVQVRPQDMTVDNFTSIASISSYIQQQQSHHE